MHLEADVSGNVLSTRTSQGQQATEQRGIAVPWTRLQREVDAHAGAPHALADLANQRVTAEFQRCTLLAKE